MPCLLTLKKLLTVLIVRLAYHFNPPLFIPRINYFNNNVLMSKVVLFKSATSPLEYFVLQSDIQYFCNWVLHAQFTLNHENITLWNFAQKLLSYSFLKFYIIQNIGFVENARVVRIYYIYIVKININTSR